MADVIGNTVQAAFAELGDGFGLSEGNINLSIGQAVVSGMDPRNGGAPFVNQLFLMGGGGPASPTSDGMNGFSTTGGAGICFRDSVEIDELRYPIVVNAMGLVPGSAGAGRYRGGLATRVEITSRIDGLVFANISASPESPPRGVQQGRDAFVGRNWKVTAEGVVEELPAATVGTLKQGERLIGVDCGGGGYGDPTERAPERVLEDVREGYEPAGRAREVYRVALIFDASGSAESIDYEETNRLRANS